MSETQDREQIPTGEASPEFPLSVANSDYDKLDDLLRAGQWQAADLETETIMLRLVGRSDYLPGAVIDKFPCGPLDTIDQIWVHRSGARFGFSIQSKILREVLGHWENFGDRVGWRVNQVWLPKQSRCYNLKAPVGHLPCAPLWLAGNGAKARNRILQRFAVCELAAEF